MNAQPASQQDCNTHPCPALTTTVSTSRPARTKDAGINEISKKTKPNGTSEEKSQSKSEEKIKEENSLDETSEEGEADGVEDHASLMLPTVAPEDPTSRAESSYRWMPLAWEKVSHSVSFCLLSFQAATPSNIWCNFVGCIVYAVFEGLW